MVAEGGQPGKDPGHSVLADAADGQDPSSGIGPGIPVALREARSHGAHARGAEEIGGGGEDRSPQLSWTGFPEGTRSFAVTVYDPDAPTEEPWVHWVIYKIPANATGLPEALPQTSRLKQDQILQGKNSWSAPNKPTFGYKGPFPPKGHGTHHYHFTLYALDAEIPLPEGSSRQDLEGAMQGHVLDETILVGLYKRSR